jgi:site-specific recombinase XerC
MTALATTLQAFFTDRLVRQRQVSPNTLCAYRDTLRLLLVFASECACELQREPDQPRAETTFRATMSGINIWFKQPPRF